MPFRRSGTPARTGAFSSDLAGKLGLPSIGGTGADFRRAGQGAAAFHGLSYETIGAQASDAGQPAGARP